MEGECCFNSSLHCTLPLFHSLFSSFILFLSHLPSSCHILHYTMLSMLQFFVPSNQTTVPYFVSSVWVHSSLTTKEMLELVNPTPLAIDGMIPAFRFGHHCNLPARSILSRTHEGMGTTGWLNMEKHKKGCLS